jgi:DNA-binding MarR family transcriptional regulator
MTSARACAHLILETVPQTMRAIGGLMRQRRAGEELPAVGQLRMLEMLRHRAWTLGELARQHQVTPSTMSRHVDVLVQRDWVARREDPRDRRQVILTLTEEGTAAHAAMLAQAEERLAELVGSLSEGERERLVAGLEVLRDLVVRSVQSACEQREDS